MHVSNSSNNQKCNNEMARPPKLQRSKIVKWRSDCGSAHTLTPLVREGGVEKVGGRQGK